MIDKSAFKDVGRNLDHCMAIYKVRIKHNMIELNEKNRAEFLMLTIAELKKGTDFEAWITDLYYNHRETFDRMMQFFAVIPTIDRDNREMERKGWFQKKQVQPALQELSV